MMLENSEILLTEPRGFCAGVERAIEIVNRAVEIFDETIYVKHEVVHNKHVIEQLVEKGVVFVERVQKFRVLWRMFLSEWFQCMLVECKMFYIRRQ